MPVWLFMGEASAVIHPLKATKESAVHTRIFTHRHYRMFKNKDQIVRVDVEPSIAEILEVGKKLTFTMTVEWADSEEYYKYNTVNIMRLFETRMERTMNPEFFRHKV